MSVLIIRNGRVAEVLKDVPSITAARRKYPWLSGPSAPVVVEGDQPPGTLYDGAGFTPPPSAAAPVPDRVTKLQLIRAMRADNKWSQLKAKIQAGGLELQEDWDAIAVIRRSDPMVATFTTELGMTEPDMDAMFRAAAGF